LTADPELAKAINVIAGKLVYEAVADAHRLPFTPLEDVLPAVAA
jgi:alanine dehydrogenase